MFLIFFYDVNNKRNMDPFLRFLSLIKVPFAAAHPYQLPIQITPPPPRTLNQILRPPKNSVFSMHEPGGIKRQFTHRFKNVKYDKTKIQLCTNRGKVPLFPSMNSRTIIFLASLLSSYRWNKEKLYSWLVNSSFVGNLIW